MDTHRSIEALSEAGLQSNIQMEASRRGWRLWRNNVGAAQIKGAWVRWGLCNSSKKQNTEMKSSDLIGITPMVIGPEHVGQVIGVFTSIEVKEPGWSYRGKGREVAQKNWIDLVRSLGGIGKFVSDIREL